MLTVDDMQACVQRAHQRINDNGGQNLNGILSAMESLGIRPEYFILVLLEWSRRTQRSPEVNRVVAWCHGMLIGYEVGRRNA